MKKKEGSFELRVTLLVIALSAALLAVFTLHKSRDPQTLALAVKNLTGGEGLSQLPMGRSRVILRSQKEKVWVDVLPKGSFMPPNSGVNDGTVFEYDLGRSKALLYHQGPWEKALMDAKNLKENDPFGN